MKKLLLIAALSATLSGMAIAEQSERQIFVTGEGRVDTAPDMATISLGVTQEAAEAGAAMRATSQKTAQILDRLSGFGIAPRDIQTQRLTLNPVWSSAQGEDRVWISGFTASNMVLVRIRDLEALGTVLDAVIESGANDFNGLSFSVQEPDALVIEARRKAVADGAARAAQLAEAAGITLGSVVSITEQSYGPPQPMMLEMTAARMDSVPVAGGEVSLSVSVSMVFAIAD